MVGGSLLLESSVGISPFWILGFEGRGLGTSRLTAEEIAAFKRVASGGFIPHARHGDIGVDALAVAGSKEAGSVFENEHIGQIQVGLAALASPCRLRGLPTLASEDGIRFADGVASLCEERRPSAGLRGWLGALLESFG